MEYFHGYLLALVIISQRVLCDPCTKEDMDKIQVCRGRKEMLDFFDKFGETGMPSMLLPNLTETAYKDRCQLFSSYLLCIKDMYIRCRNELETDAVVPGLVNYHHFVCSLPFSHYKAGYGCNAKIHNHPTVDHCDANYNSIIYPYCIKLQEWLQCYSKAVSIDCQSPADKYVMVAQTKLLERTIHHSNCKVAAKFMHNFYPMAQNNKDKRYVKKPDRGWVHAVWVVMALVVIGASLFAFFIYKKRYGPFSRSRLQNETV